MISAFAVSFIALFIAIDVIAILPIFMSLTEGLKPKERKEILNKSLYTASMVAVGFMLLGGIVFKIMGIRMADFQIAGGILLLVFSVNFLMNNNEPKRAVSKDSAVFPLDKNLIVGPAVLTTMLILKDLRGLVMTMIAFFSNMFLVFFIFKHSQSIEKFLGPNGIRSVSKVFDILLSAFAIMLIRKGVSELFFLR